MRSNSVLAVSLFVSSPLFSFCFVHYFTLTTCSLCRICLYAIDLILLFSFCYQRHEHQYYNDKIEYIWKTLVLVFVWFHRMRYLCAHHLTQFECECGHMLNHPKRLWIVLIGSLTHIHTSTHPHIHLSLYLSRFCVPNVYVNKMKKKKREKEINAKC